MISTGPYALVRHPMYAGATLLFLATPLALGLLKAFVCARAPADRCAGAASARRGIQPKIRDARARIAFYASTPGYVAAFEHLGLGEMARKAQVLSKAQRWEELPPLIGDEVLDQFAVIGTYDQIAKKLTDRFGKLVTNVEFSIAVKDERDKALLAQMAREIQADDGSAARRAIKGEAA